MKIDKMVETLLAAKDAYYSGNPIMSDDEFDSLEDKLKKIDPENSYFSIVGATINTKAKAKHEIPMLSCDKGKSPEEIFQWIKKLGIESKEIVIEPKIDGLSCSLLYENGKLVRVATRGDGTIGQNITHVSSYVKDIPKTIKMMGRKEIRGELYLPKNTPNPNNKPLRNMAVGFVNRKDSGIGDLRFVHFVAYQFVDLDEVKHIPRFENDKLLHLQDEGFNRVMYQVVSFSSVEKIEKIYKEYLNKLRSLWEYETDGLVLVVNDTETWVEIDSRYVVSHHHFYNMALKPPAQSTETVIESIDWQVSRFGKVIPTANVTPVLIDGRVVHRASLSNYKNVLRMKLEKGDKVLIEVAGDIIPYLAKNISKDISQR